MANAARTRRHEAARTITSAMRSRGALAIAFSALRTRGTASPIMVISTCSNSVVAPGGVAVVAIAVFVGAIVGAGVLVLGGVGVEVDSGVGTGAGV